MDRLERNIRLAAALANVRGAKFASFLYRTTTGKLARYTVLLGTSFVNLYKADLAELTECIASLRATLANNPEDRASVELSLKAAEELHSSKVISLAEWEEKRFNPAYTRGGHVEPIENIPGLMWVTDAKTGDKHLAVKALNHHTEVIEPGEPKKPVKSAPLTIAKNEIRNRLPSRRIVEFKLDTIGDARLNGETLELIPEGQL